MERFSDDAPVADLRIVVLVQERTHDIVYELIFAIDHIKRERSGKEDDRRKDQLADDFEKEPEEFLHSAFRLS